MDEVRKLVFTRFHSDGKEMFNDIFAVDPDGKNETRLTMNPGPNGEYADNAAPRYNRNRTMLAFVSTKNNPSKFYNIFLLDLATRKTAQVTTGNLNMMSVDWAPDDSKLVFSCCDEKGLQQVHLVAMDGSGFTRLTEGPAEHMNPLWSPRGDLIVYVEFPKEGEMSSIWTMDPSGQGKRKLTRDDAPHTTPSWSPDGSWVVYRCDIGKPHLRKINVDTGELVVFDPPLKGADSSPIWAGDEIVFSSNCDWEEAESIFNLYRMSSSGKLLKRITNNQTYEYCGDW